MASKRLRENFYVQNRKKIGFLNANFLIRVHHLKDGKTELKGAGMLIDFMNEESFQYAFARIEKRTQPNFTWWNGKAATVSIKFLAK